MEEPPKTPKQDEFTNIQAIPALTHKQIYVIMGFCMCTLLAIFIAGFAHIKNNPIQTETPVSENSDLVVLAELHELSEGAIVLLEKINAINPHLPLETLATLSLDELDQLLDVGATTLPLGQEQAIEIARESIPLTAEQTPDPTIISYLNWSTPFYQVGFVTETHTYDLQIHGFDGRVLSTVRRTIDGEIHENTPESDQNSQPTTPSIVVNRESVLITCFMRAGVTSSQVTDTTFYRNGDQYDVTFWSNNIQYIFAISATDLEVLSYDMKLGSLSGEFPSFGDDLKTFEDITTPSATQPFVGDFTFDPTPIT